MSNQRFRSRVEGRIAEALRIHAEACTENHPGLAGLAQEITIEILARQYGYETTPRFSSLADMTFDFASVGK